MFHYCNVDQLRKALKDNRLHPDWVVLRGPDGSYMVIPESQILVPYPGDEETLAEYVETGTVREWMEDLEIEIC